MVLVVKVYLYVLKLVGLLRELRNKIFTLTKIKATGSGGVDFDFRDRKSIYMKYKFVSRVNVCAPRRLAA